MKGARPLNQREAQALLRAIQGPYAVRDRCLIQLGLNVGLRISNLVHLTVGQVSHAGRPLRYLRLPAREMKSRRGHTIPLNSPARARRTSFLFSIEAEIGRSLRLSSAPSQHEASG